MRCLHPYEWRLFGLLNIYPFSWPAKHEMEARQRKEILNLGTYKNLFHRHEPNKGNVFWQGFGHRQKETQQIVAKKFLYHCDVDISIDIDGHHNLDFEKDHAGKEFSWNSIPGICCTFGHYYITVFMNMSAHHERNWEIFLQFIVGHFLLHETFCRC